MEGGDEGAGDAGVGGVELGGLAGGVDVLAGEAGVVAADGQALVAQQLLAEAATASMRRSLARM